MTELLKYRINVMDTETTGFQGPPNGNVVEIAVTPLDVYYTPEGVLHDMKIRETVSSLADPGMKIPIEAMMVHHIRDDMVQNMAPAAAVLDTFKEMPCDYWVAHNAAFDRKFFDDPAFKWICTLQVAKRIFPESKKHSNQYLRYRYGLDAGMDQRRVEPAHRAGPDTYMTAFLLAFMLKKNLMTLEDMHNASGGNVALPSEEMEIQFGKHTGTKWKDIPISYLNWLAKNGNGEGAGLAKAEIERRRK